MIKKIISGGQTGADRAALDVAIKLDIPHGGWIPKGRKTEDGILPEKYHLKEMQTSSYPKRTEQNVLDSDGTLIISHGKLTGGSALTQKFATQHNKPFLYIDLNSTTAFIATGLINTWLLHYKIEVLNVAGPRASKDPKIHRLTADILESVIFLNAMATDMPPDFKIPIVLDGMIKLIDLPKTVGEAVEFLIPKLSFRDKSIIANMELEHLSSLNLSLGEFIRCNFYLWEGNIELLESCRSMSGKPNLSEDDASMVIIEELWKSIKATHKQLTCYH